MPDREIPRHRSDLLYPREPDDRYGRCAIGSFLADGLHVTLARRLHALAPGPTPRSVLEKFAAMQMIDVHLPTNRRKRGIFCRTTPVFLKYRKRQDSNRDWRSQIRLELLHPRIEGEGKLSVGVARASRSPLDVVQISGRDERNRSPGLNRPAV